MPEGGADSRLGAYLELAALADREYVEHLYRLLLRRDPLPEDRERFVRALGEGTLSRATFARDLVTGPEFVRIRALDDALSFARWARLNDERPRLLGGPPASDERVIEIPWVLSRYRGERRVLDIGSVNAEPAYLAALLELGADDLVGVDLVTGQVPGMRIVAADVRTLPFADRSFDIVFCVSTLEHVGQDNRVYGLAAERDPAAGKLALRELKRVLAPHGRAFLTVPCGDSEDADWFVQQAPDEWERLFAEGGFFVYESEVYVLDGKGWRSTDEAPAIAGRYGEYGPGASSVLCAELRLGKLIEGTRRAAGRSLRALKLKGR